MKVGLVAQKENARAASLAGRLREMLHGQDVTVVVDTATATALDVPGVDPSAMDDADLAVSIGGDGTFLFTARGVGTVPIVGVNLGEVGFLNAVSPEDAVDVVREEVDRFESTGAVRTREMSRLRARGDGWDLDPAVNEIVVQGPQRGHGNGGEFEVRVDGELYSGSAADGVLVATPAGSTAYNMSEGGPLVRPEVDAVVVTEMCAGEPMPSLVSAADSTVTVRIDDAEMGYVISDGRAQQELEPPTTVTVERASEPVRLAGPPSEFFKALNKLD
ncbi:NAD(+)/NADH kinase [Haloarchaeobius iranensis]|uniref:NAD kinase n=1 Tax=Haloarchaeobius iranensis TaxID=996166 RepID=A0A1G9ZY25_9EURY|nr:NAD(+)/NADH kinase [Haloarchaeobius iranensis]SDN26210.1 NAD+ kinase [Haloarchaeobius iranensis]